MLYNTEVGRTDLSSTSGEQEGDVLFRGCQRPVVADQRRLERLDRPPQQSRRTAGRRHHVTDATARRVADPLTEPPGGDRLLARHHPRALCERLPPGRQHVVGGTLGYIYVSRPRLASDVGHAMGERLVAVDVDDICGV